MIKRIVSGEQTGVDQAALDAARNLNVPYGIRLIDRRKNEDGNVFNIYPSEEISIQSCSKRAAKSIIDSDGTLIISHGNLTGGSARTRAMAIKYNRPWFHIDLDQTATIDAITAIYTWIDTYEIEILNVAGPRAGKDPKLYEAARDILEAVICLDHVENGRESGMLNLFAFPVTVFEAVERLISELSLKDKVNIAHMSEKDLGVLCFYLKAHIKDEFGLDMGNEELMKSCLCLSEKEKINEDEVSSLIIEALWKKLRKTHRLRLVE